MITQQVQYPSKTPLSKTHVDVDSADPILAQCPKPLSLRFPYGKTAWLFVSFGFYSFEKSHVNQGLRVR